MQRRSIMLKNCVKGTYTFLTMFQVLPARNLCCFILIRIKKLVPCVRKSVNDIRHFHLCES